MTKAEDDARYKVLWDGLSKDEKNALFDLASLMGDSSQFRSLRELLKAQVKISAIIATRDHLAWIWRVVLKVGTLAGVIVGVLGAWKVFFEK